jgi:hypothetical protein
MTNEELKAKVQLILDKYNTLFTKLLDKYAGAEIVDAENEIRCFGEETVKNFPENRVTVFYNFCLDELNDKEKEKFNKLLDEFFGELDNFIEVDHNDGSGGGLVYGGIALTTEEL